MNTKVANLIALELGILIAILAWLAFSNLSSVKQPRVAEEQERAIGSFATVSPVHKSGNQALSAVDYRAGGGAGQQGDEEQVPTVQQYDQAIATQPYTSSNVDDSLTTGTSPYYAGGYQQTVPYPPDCPYSSFDDYALYPPTTEIVVFSNTQSFLRRPRQAIRFSRPRMMPPRTMVMQPRPGGRQPFARSGGVGGGVVNRRTANPRSSRPSQGFGPR